MGFLATCMVMALSARLGRIGAFVECDDEVQLIQDARVDLAPPMFLPDMSEQALRDEPAKSKSEFDNMNKKQLNFWEGMKKLSLDRRLEQLQIYSDKKWNEWQNWAKESGSLNELNGPNATAFVVKLCDQHGWDLDQTMEWYRWGKYHGLFNSLSPRDVRDLYPQAFPELPESMLALEDQMWRKERLSGEPELPLELMRPHRMRTGEQTLAETEVVQKSRHAPVRHGRMSEAKAPVEQLSQQQPVHANRILKADALAKPSIEAHEHRHHWHHRRHHKSEHDGVDYPRKAFAAPSARPLYDSATTGDNAMANMMWR